MQLYTTQVSIHIFYGLNLHFVGYYFCEFLMKCQFEVVLKLVAWKKIAISLKDDWVQNDWIIFEMKIAELSHFPLDLFAFPDNFLFTVEFQLKIDWPRSTYCIHEYFLSDCPDCWLDYVHSDSWWKQVFFLFFFFFICQITFIYIYSKNKLLYTLYIYSYI